VKYEKPLPGNPNGITVNQHVFPRRAIARFEGADGCVDVQRVVGGARFKVKPDNPMFCAKRAWDQSTETHRTLPIEKAYAKLADELVDGEVKTLTDQMNGVVSEFFTLWRLRHEARQQPVPDTKLNLIAADQSLSKEAEEVLETKGAVFARGDTVPGRFLTSISLMRKMYFHAQALKGVRWGIVRAVAAHFLVPDSPGGLCVVPVSPTICLCKDIPNVVLQASRVAEVNRQLVDQAHDYYFSDDLGLCPIEPR
jgi:hypothetical protein